MFCKKYENNAVLYLYDELDPKAAKEFKAHVHHCPKCRRALNEMQHTVQLVSTLPKERADRSAIRHIMHHVEKPFSITNKMAKWRTWFSGSRLPWALAAAAASVILVLSLWNPFSVPDPNQAYDLLAWNSGIDVELDHIELEITEMYPDYDYSTEETQHIETRIDLIESSMKSLSQDIETMSF